MTISQLFAGMSPSLANEILDVMFNTQKELYKSTMAAVAQVTKVRPVFLERLARPERHVKMQAGLGRSDMSATAANILTTWLVKTQSPLLCDFLDALKIKHEQGVVEELPQTMDDDSLLNALEVVLTKYPHEIVSVYLHAFDIMNDTRWPSLETLLEADPRLRLGKS